MTGVSPSKTQEVVSRLLDSRPMVPKPRSGTVTVPFDQLVHVVREGPCPKARANLNGRRSPMSDGCPWCMLAMAVIAG